MAIQEANRIAVKKYRQTDKGRQNDRKKSKKYYNTINGYLRHIFNCIKQRCDNPIKQNKCYNKVKNLFISSDEFVNYVINELQIDPRGLQIHRIDNNGHYKPGNIEFLTLKKHKEIHYG